MQPGCKRKGDAKGTVLFALGTVLFALGTVLGQAKRLLWSRALFANRTVPFAYGGEN